jgi:hypothetical protein
MNAPARRWEAAQEVLARRAIRRSLIDAQHAAVSGGHGLGSFGPDEIAVMAAAFEGILCDFRLKDRDDPVVEMIAKLIIELVRNGERDPIKVRKEILGRPRLM